LIDVVAPKAGLTNDEIIVAKWFKAVGDRVSVDEVLAEVETDKATYDILSQVDGVVEEIVAVEGTTVGPGEVIARVRANR
jgi:2-oxoglutarate dehydrogenase E2 component (dihydrolipoamide succinyltransferase)